MKIAFVSDNHFCTSSSVISKRGKIFSTRLENQIESIRWVHSLGLPVIHLGDFFDRAIITSEERSALDEVKDIVKNWTFLLGNHEYSGDFDQLGSLNGDYIRKPTVKDLFGLKTLFLPFNSTENDIEGHYDLILGHLPLKDIPFGAKGLDFEVIDRSCDIFLNGHLHNRHRLSENKWNMGSLTAQNFSDECSEYRKGIVILDTETKEIEFVENPFAYNFFKFTWDEFNKFSSIQKQAITRPTSCISMTCGEGEKKEIIESGIFSSVYYLRISEDIKLGTSPIKVENRPIEGLDHLKKFRESFIEKAGNTPLVLEELAEVFR